MLKLVQVFLLWINVIETNSELGTLLPTAQISKGANRRNYTSFLNKNDRSGI